jgi:hypothetical protein
MTGGTTVNGMNHCLKTAQNAFKVGDSLVSSGGGQVVSDGVNPPFVVGTINGSGWNGGQASIPLSVLNKVASNIDASQLNTYINNVSQSNDISTKNTNTSPTTTNPTTAKRIFTTKNIVIGVLAIGAILGLLKWQKVI